MQKQCVYYKRGVRRVFIQWKARQQFRTKSLPNSLQSVTMNHFGGAMNVANRVFSNVLDKLTVDGAQLIGIVKIVRINQ